MFYIKNDHSDVAFFVEFLQKLRQIRRFLPFKVHISCRSNKAIETWISFA